MQHHRCWWLVKNNWQKSLEQESNTEPPVCLANLISNTLQYSITYEFQFLRPLLIKVALSRFNWCQNFVLRFFILSATKNLRRSKYSNFLLIKKLSVLVCANFWLQRGWKIGVQNFGTNWIEINLPLKVSN